MSVDCRSLPQVQEFAYVSASVHPLLQIIAQRGSTSRSLPPTGRLENSEDDVGGAKQKLSPNQHRKLSFSRLCQGKGVTTRQRLRGKPD